MILIFWLAGFWFTMSLVEPAVDESKTLKMMLEVVACYLTWPLILGTYLRSKLEKEE